MPRGPDIRKSTPRRSRRVPRVAAFMRHRGVALFVVLFLALPMTAHGQRARVTVNVITPPSTPKHARIVIVGNDSLLGRWEPAGIPMKRVKDSLWTITRTFSAGRSIEFKITRGSWPTEAVYQSGRIPPNIRLLVEADTTLTLRPVGWADSVHREIVGKVTGTVRRHPAMGKSILDHPRDVVVWLPPSYDAAPARRYPVLYMHDGQNIVDPATSAFGFDWRVDEVSDSLITAGAMEEIIVVGINSRPERFSEYSWTDKGKRYAAFVVRTLKPFIDSTYRTLSDRTHTAVMGSSMGGLASFLFVWWYSDVFSMAGCLSSAFSYDPGDILKEVRLWAAPRKDIRVYMDCGTGGVDQELIKGNEDMFALLKGKGYVPGKSIEYFLDQGADHNEQAWAARVWRPLTFMFGLQQVQQRKHE